MDAARVQSGSTATDRGGSMRDDTDHRPWEEGSSRTRVLLECAASSSPSIIARVVERHGFDVRTCEGPGDRGGCDLIDHGACALVSGADVVVNMLAAGDRASSDVLDAVLGERRPPAAVVELTPARRAEVGHDDVIGPRRVTVIETPVSGIDLVAGIRTAIERRERSVPWWGDGYS